MPNIELGAGGREQLPLTVYVWVVVFFEEPGILLHVTAWAIGAVIRENLGG